MIVKYAFILFILFLSLTTFYLSRHPGHNGDMPFYIACSMEMEQGSMDGVVVRTQEILRRELQPAQYKEHAERLGQAYPRLFDFYRIKPFYILLVVIFHKLGFSYISATVVPSLIGYFLIGISIWRFAIQIMDPIKTFLVSAICVVIPPTTILAVLSTPDAISGFVMLNALLLMYFGRSKILWFSLFCVAICTRPDNLIAELIFLFALWKWPSAGFKNKLNKWQFAGFSVVLTAVAFLVNLATTHHFMHAGDPLKERLHGDYFLNVMSFLLYIPFTFFMTLVIIFIMSRLSRGFSYKDAANYFFYTACTVVFMRLFLYPFYEERFFTAVFLTSILVIAGSSAGLKKPVEWLAEKEV